MVDAGLPAVVAVEGFDCVRSDEPWRFAQDNRAAIDAHFDELRSDKPALWNGRVLMLADPRIEAGILRGRWFETDFASMLAWKAWGCPDMSVRNCFAQGALRGADGAFVLGVMASHTANAGRIYFPSGTPDRDDLVDGRVDLAGSVVREVAEETGLGPDDYAPAPLWHGIDSQGRLALIRVLQVSETAEALRRRIRRTLAAAPQPELADLFVARGEADLDPAMPDFVRAYLSHVWR